MVGFKKSRNCAILLPLNLPPKSTCLKQKIQTWQNAPDLNQDYLWLNVRANKLQKQTM